MEEQGPSPLRDRGLHPNDGLRRNLVARQENTTSTLDRRCKQARKEPMEGYSPTEIYLTNQKG